MSILDSIKSFFVNDEERSVENTIKKLSSKNTTLETRQAAVDRLKEIDSDSARIGLLHRFDFTSDKGIEDHEEKEEIENIMLSFGEKSINPLKEYIKTFYTIAWPLKILSRLISKEEQVTFMLSLLHTGDIFFNEKELEKRVEILKHLKDYEDGRIVKKVREFLHDLDDRVKFAAIEILANQKSDEVREDLLKILIDNEQSVRIKTKIMDAFAKLGWRVHGYRKKVEEVLGSEYKLTSEGIIKYR